MFVLRRKNNFGEILKDKYFNIINPMDERYFGKECICWKRKKNYVWWILYDDQKPIGFCGIKVNKNLGYVYLIRSAILKKYRGMGLGKRMIKSRLKYCEEKLGLKYIVTDCHRENLPSISNLKSFGFEQYNPSVLWALDESIYLRKIL